MRVAIYARVSTERQERQQTIHSQLAALQAWVVAQGHALSDAHVFRDEGYSGSRLDRPGLDGLRDAIRDAAVDIVAVFSPDRLARKYAYQVLLLEEFRRADCEVAFLHHPISDNPNDQLLLQIQGAIAEYERAVLAERFRRGKLQKARDGHILSAKAPYGYRYETRCGALPARLVVDEAEADMVRQVYGWFVSGETIRKCIARLNAGPWLTRSGRSQWSCSVVHHILSDPVYTGTAYSNRYEYVVPKKPRLRTRRSGERSCRHPRPPEQWIAIPVPALIEQRTWDCAKAQLARNATMSFRRNKKNDYLLRCLLKCGNCGLGIHGLCFPGVSGRPGHRYYKCAGTDPLTTGRETRCPRARIDANTLEQAVWDHVAGLLGSPTQLSAQFERFVTEADVAQARDEVPNQQICARMDRMDRADRRLLEAYQAEVITLVELAERRQSLAEQRRLAEQQLEQHRRLREQQVHTRDVLDSLAAFSERIGTRLHSASIADRQALLQLVVERITVHDDHLEIQHVIPLRDPTPGPTALAAVKPRLRSDGVRPASRLDD
ncbi:MAG: recombinase family protein, partial [Janthinobacterium lividum]